ncbi:hypothetical protein b3_0136 [Synechococcus phage B3]|nr:hypothetical protein b3_0136 [Synechococcus phage B3]QGT54750.1 hypothetical protein b23_0135 [Synechococcus phage B23]
MIYFYSNLGAVSCVICAALLAYHNMPGWGWFLFSGVLMTSYASSKETTTEDDTDTTIEE